MTQGNSACSTANHNKPIDHVAQTYARLAVSLLVPVTITVWTVVWAVLNLTPLYTGSTSSPLFLVKNENDSSTSGAKFGDSLINALVIVAAITVMTFLIVLLYKCGCIKLLIGWFILSAALTFFFLTWIFVDLIFTRYQVSYDYITMSFFLWNFGIVGLVSLFYHGNKVLTQVYLVVLSVIMSWVLTRLPEWSTWSILVLVAIYDVVAVLCPGGPLKLLLAAAHERNEPIPGFIYDSDHTADALLRDNHTEQDRPAARNINMNTKKKKKNIEQDARGGDMTDSLIQRPKRSYSASSTSSAPPHDGQGNNLAYASPSGGGDTTVQTTSPIVTNNTPLEGSREGEEMGIGRGGESEMQLRECEEEGSHRQEEEAAERKDGIDIAVGEGAFGLRVVEIPRHVSKDMNAAQLGEGDAVGEFPSIQTSAKTRKMKREEDEDEEEGDAFTDVEEARPFKLGLGDFIFYSLLCGRAATASYVAWTSAYIAVTMGLLGTLTSLLFFRNKIPALPALPISIFLGVGINFMGRYVMSDYCLFMVQFGLGL